MKTGIQIVGLFFCIALLSTCGRLQPSDESEKASSEQGKTGTMVAFKFTTESRYGTFAGENITVSVPVGTDKTNLKATFLHTGTSVRVGSAVQTSSVTANNFSSPVVYTVIGTGGATRNYTVNVVTSSTDIFAPIMTGVTLMPASVSTFPTTVTLLVNYTETGSSFSSGSVSFCSPTAFSTYSIQGQKITATLTSSLLGFAGATVDLSTFHESGAWRLCDITLTDANGNKSNYMARSNSQTPFEYKYYLSPGGYLMNSGVTVPAIEVTNTTPDLSAPQLTTIAVTPASITPPGSATIRVDYSETGSGFNSGYVRLCSPTYLNSSGGTSVIQSLSKVGGYGQTTVSFQNYHEGGNWKICGVSLTDVVGNNSYYTYTPPVSSQNLALGEVDTGVPFGGPLTINSSNPDSTPPVLTSITTTPATVSDYPAVVTVRIYFTETGSGSVYGGASLCSPSSISGSSGSNSIEVSGVTNMGTHLQGTVTLQSSHETGVWKICSLYLSDIAWNSRSYISSIYYFPGNYFYSQGPIFTPIDSGIALTGSVVKN